MEFMEQKMPNQNLHLFFVILGFLLGIIWGVLALSPYKKMKKAIEDGDAVEAQKMAQKIRMWMIVGIVVNVVVIAGRMI